MACIPNRQGGESLKIKFGARACPFGIYSPPRPEAEQRLRHLKQSSNRWSLSRDPFCPRQVERLPTFQAEECFRTIVYPGHQPNGLSPGLKSCGPLGHWSTDSTVSKCPNSRTPQANLRRKLPP